MTTPDDPQDRDDEPGTSPEPESEVEDRAAILRRRAMFIASAIAGLGMAAGCSEPQPCLNIAIPHEPPADAGAADAEPLINPEPQPCLSVYRPPVPDPLDAGTDAPEDAGRPKPAPCLKMAPPRPCLDMNVPDR